MEDSTPLPSSPPNGKKSNNSSSSSSTSSSKLSRYFSATSASILLLVLFITTVVWTHWSDIVSKHGQLSWGAKGILWGFELLQEGLAWQVGLPSLLDAWHDRWIDGCSLGQILNLEVADLASKPPLTVCQLQSFDGCWNVERIIDLCGTGVLPSILSIPISLATEVDSFYWNFTKSGDYSIKSGYALAFDKLWNKKASDKDRRRISFSTASFCKNRLWNLPIHGKWKIFLWKILSQSLPCGAEFKARGFDQCSQCQLCEENNRTTESLEHLFRDCQFAKRFWFGSPLSINCLSGDNIPIQQWIINWINFLISKGSSLESIPLFVSTLWRLWCIRNEKVFRGMMPDLSTSFRLLTDDASCTISARSGGVLGIKKVPVLSPEEMEVDMLIRNYFPILLVGSRICPEHIRIKCDAAWNSNLKAAAGWVMMDPKGFIIHSGHLAFWSKSVLQAEAKALFLALDHALKLGFRHIDASSDCLSLVLEVNEAGNASQDTQVIIKDLKRLIYLCHCFSLSHCPRRLNRRAHMIAKSAMM